MENDAKMALKAAGRGIGRHGAAGALAGGASPWGAGSLAHTRANDDAKLFRMASASISAVVRWRAATACQSSVCAAHKTNRSDRGNTSLTSASPQQFEFVGVSGPTAAPETNGRTGAGWLANALGQLVHTRKSVGDRAAQPHPDNYFHKKHKMFKSLIYILFCKKLFFFA